MAGREDQLRLADQLLRAGRLDEAAATLSGVLRFEPNNAAVLTALGTIYLRKGDAAEGVRLLDASLAIKRDQPNALNNRGLGLTNLGRLEEAVASFDRAIAVDRTYADAYSNRGNAQRALGRNEDAKRSYDRAISLRPQSLGALLNRGTLLIETGEAETSLRDFNAALKLAPRAPEALYGAGYALRRLARNEEALIQLGAALAERPDYFEARLQRAFALTELNRAEAACDDYRQAIALRPQDGRAFQGLSQALYQLNHYDEALAAIDNSLAVGAPRADALNSRGNILMALRRQREALDCFSEAILLAPANAQFYANRATTFFQAKSYLASARDYIQALALSPHQPLCHGGLLHAKMMACEWQGLDELLTDIEAETSAGYVAAAPFHVLAAPIGAAAELQVARRYCEAYFPATSAELPAPREGGKIKLGYYCGELRNHPTGYLVAELMERHDRAQFEVISFSFNPPGEDEMTARIGAALDRIVDINGMSDAEVAARSRELGIDIAIDLTGHTSDARTGIFAQRAAPVQVSYLAFPGTSGAPFLDYLIADGVLIPPAQQAFYSEKIAYLPDSYQPNDRLREIAPKSFTRSELGLPESGFVFCCFNANYKITPDVFARWMELLKQVEGSVLWLFEGNGESPDQLRGAAARSGVAPERLVFAPRMELPLHLARHAQADLFIDTFHYNAHTTASDALWTGLPVVTLLGDTFAGRVAASLLTAVGLPELITKTSDEYSALALELATHPEKLAVLKAKLAAQRPSAPLFDTTRYAQHLEAAYREMHRRACAGEAPDHIWVEPIEN